MIIHPALIIFSCHSKRHEESSSRIFPGSFAVLRVARSARYFFTAIPFWIAFTTPSLLASLILRSMPFFS